MPLSNSARQSSSRHRTCSPPHLSQTWTSSVAATSSSTSVPRRRTRFSRSSRSRSTRAATCSWASPTASCGRRGSSRDHEEGRDSTSAAPSPTTPSADSRSGSGRRRRRGAREQMPRSQQPALLSLPPQILLDHFGASLVLIDARGYDRLLLWPVRASTCAHPTGRADLNLFSMARPRLSGRLRVGVRQAVEQNAAVHLARVAARHGWRLRGRGRDDHALPADRQH